MPLDIDRFSHLESPLQRWDPRVKIGSLAVFVFFVAMLKTLPIAVVALLIALVFLRISALPMHFISHGMTWVMVFLLPFFLILPFSYPGEASLHILGLPFAWEGLRLASLIFIKANTIVLTSFAMFGTSRFDVSMLALQQLKCPKIVVQMVLFTYRYTFTFLDEMKRMQTSMRARGFMPGPNMYTLHTYGNFVGTLLVRSFERTERIYKAMLSKGYQGEFHSMVTFRSDGGDYVKAGLVLFVAVIVLWADKSGVFSIAVQAWF